MTLCLWLIFILRCIVMSPVISSKINHVRSSGLKSQVSNLSSVIPMITIHFAMSRSRVLVESSALNLDGDGLSANRIGVVLPTSQRVLVLV